MAILSKIRERSMFLIIIIGLALFAFVLDPSTLGDFFNSSKVNEIGEVNGEVISRQEFATAVDQYKNQVGVGVSDMQATKTVWDNLVRKKVYQNQLSEAGISVGEEDVWNELLNSSAVNNNPQFLNEAGLFDENKFKQFLVETKELNPELWAAWSNFMNQIRDNAKTNTYNNLVTAGLGASLKEGETDYLSENTKMNAQFVFVPYTSIADSLITVTKSEVESYIKGHAKDFQVEASRNIAYVKFDIIATAEDEEVIKSELVSLSTDFKNTSNMNEFFAENISDVALDENFKYKNQINPTIREDVFAGKEGDFFGPYKDQGFFKMSKITEVSKIPDSVKASHILIPYVGAQGVGPDVTRTEEAAKNRADSILKVLKRNSRKFADLAKEFSSDKTNSDNGGELDWFTYNTMTPAFRDFTFTNKKGTLDVVQTPYGFHIVKVGDQKNIQTVLKLATFGRNIVPSEATENAVFQKSEQFALQVSKSDNYFDVVKENNYESKSAVGLKVLDENVPGLGNQRQIVSWAFGKETNLEDFKRFDLEGSHVVSIITDKTEKGLMSALNATARVRPILVNDKKAKLIEATLNGTTLNELATATNTSVKTASGFNLKSSTLTGVGVEPKVVGAMYNAEVNKVYNNIQGTRGVFAFKVTSKELPTALPNYDMNRNRIAESRKSLTFRIYDAIKNSSEITDNRAILYTN